jgi:SnoaL-like domain
MADLQTLIDRQEITDLTSRLGRWLDEKRFSQTEDLFTADVTVRTAGGEAQGAERVAAQAARNHTTDTQHVITNVLVDLDGDRATAVANLVVTFNEPRRTLGERYRFEAARTAEGWRLSRVEIKPVWEA